MLSILCDITQHVKYDHLQYYSMRNLLMVDSVLMADDVVRHIYLVDKRLLMPEGSSDQVMEKVFCLLH